MPNASGKTTSSWMATATVPHFDPLAENTTADVCVVGAGIAGLSTAYELARRGKKVVVLDDNVIGEGESGRTTGHLSFALDDRFSRLETIHGQKGAQLAAESHRAAVDRIEEIVRLEAIDCGFERLNGYLFADDGQDPAELQKELEAAHRAGLADVAFATEPPVDGLDPARCLRFPGQGQFHVLKYLSALAGAIAEQGGRIHTATHVRKVNGGKRPSVETDKGLKVEADSIVVATNAPISDWVAMHTKLYPYRTYAIAAQMNPGTAPHALLWDLADPYHYVRAQRERPKGGGEPMDLLIVGGEDHKVGQDDQPAQNFDRLEAWARKKFPDLGYVAFRWSGQVVEPQDGLAYIGRDPGGGENVYIITGDSGHGLTHGVLGSLLLTGLIVDGDHPWKALYEPSRKSLRTAGTFLKENLNVAKQYGDWLTGGDVKSPSEIEPGCGAVVREGRSKVAVYRDPAGNYTRRSAVCPHLGCIVHWNDLEKSWDCPCHGSRFAPDGHVLNGPSLAGLPPAD
jgi:glycine/D-amino acid oxidase-like deaminating enzyme/nitrite reductase/ring-hydroxylating ferredoxin subunit